MPASGRASLDARSDAKLRKRPSGLPSVRLCKRARTLLAALSRNMGRPEEDLQLALASRGAVSEGLLQRLQATWRPMMWRESLLTFTGRSVTSVVDVSLRCGRLSSSALAALQAAAERVAWKPKFPTESGNLEAHFRTQADAPGAQTNGADFRAMAPREVQAFVQAFLDGNADFVRGLSAYGSSASAYRHKGGTASCFAQTSRLASNFFAYGALQHFPRGACDVWHCDGGPGMLLLAVSVRGGRVLEFEDAAGNAQRLELPEGKAYLSSPACFWHCVKPLGHEPATSLILRSAVLTGRYSGGRGSWEQRDKGTSGYALQTKSVFEEAAQTIAGLIENSSLTFDFGMPV
mmetsp:Transcript_76639/g.211718  ORF Transcript_76639/g.211718 Transcript_76639/m.211718 type:complete len:348 (+) Transcript_76639:62-1105(+)